MGQCDGQRDFSFSVSHKNRKALNLKKSSKRTVKMSKIRRPYDRKKCYKEEG